MMNRILGKIKRSAGEGAYEEGDSQSWMSWAIHHPDIMADLAYVESVAPMGSAKTPHKVARINRNATEASILKGRREFLKDPGSYIDSIEFFDSLIMLCLEKEGYRVKIHLVDEGLPAFDLVAIRGFHRSDGRIELLACAVSESSMDASKASSFRKCLESVENDPAAFVKSEFAVSNHPVKVERVAGKVFCRNGALPDAMEELGKYGGVLDVDLVTGKDLIEYVTKKLS